MPERHGAPEKTGTVLAGGRLLLRGVLIAAIAGLAWYRGFSPRVLSALVLLLLWAAALPWLLQAARRLLAPVAPPWRSVLLLVAAVAMLAAFFLVARATLTGVV